MWKQFRILALASLGALGIVAAAGLVWLAEPPRGTTGVRPAAKRPPAPVAASAEGSLPVDCCDRLPPAIGPEDDPMEGVVRTLTGTGYAAAAKQAVAIADRESRLQCLLAVAAGWSRTEPREAVRFALSLPAGTERREVLAEVMAQWSAHDAVAAGVWLDGLAPDADLDGALAVGATLARGEPDIALGWAARIGHAGTRWETIRAIVQDWAVRDESAARFYVEKIPELTPEQRRQLDRRIAQHTRLLD